MGKNFKSYATTQVHFPREREGSLTAKSPNLLFKNMIWLNRTYYSLLNFTSKIFQNLVFQAKFKQIKQNLLNLLIYSANCAKFAPIINLFVLCFRHLPWQRTLWNSSELRKFCAIHPHSPRITRNSHFLLTYSTLCFRHLPQQRMLRNSSELRKFRAICPHSPRITRNSHHLLTLHLTFQMPDQWQKTP